MHYTPDLDAYLRILGKELFRLRSHRRLSQSEVLQRSQRLVSASTLSTYENAKSSCGVVRFVDVCAALDELPHRVLQRVDATLLAGSPSTRITINLRTILYDTHTELAELRLWAQQHLDRHAISEVHVDLPMLEQIARATLLPAPFLVMHLVRLNPNGVNNDGCPLPATDRGDSAMGGVLMG